jgi:hypothetical protein
MTTNPSAPKPEDVLSELFSTFFKPTTTNSTTTKVTAPTVDHVAEASRLLKKAEEAASGSVNESETLIQIADRHIRIIDTALAYQR